MADVSEEKKPARDPLMGPQMSAGVNVSGAVVLIFLLVVVTLFILGVI